ncbi:TonB-dependent receptor [Lacimicrobium sp. SS2-24]|uniref:TonB-dependent receptor n=1 Tax=Lacimicrobium sp. SS2-24 TaxID=2005569 RepID=UPI000B4A6BAC|nr:TonB-dependent receptor [Lacimicrobium sp. SS2-24]
MKYALSAIAVSTLAYIGMVPSQALAQQSEDVDEVIEVEQIMVTAQKRGENLQEVPLAVSVLNSAALDRNGIQTFQDVQHSTPNLTMAVASPFATTVNMRGIPSNPNGVFNSGASPGLGIYVDGVVYARPSGFNQELTNIERVEVLRGPQGTLFGQNTNLGVINITTRKPSHYTEGKVKATVGNYGLRKLNGYISGSLVEDTVAAAVSLFEVSRDGYSENIGEGNDVGTADRFGGRVQFRVTPSDAWTLDINADFLKDDSIPEAEKLVGFGRGLGFIAGLNAGVNIADFITDAPRQVNINTANHYVFRDNWGLDATVSYQFASGMEFKSITAKKIYDASLGYDEDAMPLDFNVGLQGENTEQFTQEFQLISPAENDFRYVLGAYYLDNESESIQDFVTPSGVMGIPTGLPAPLPQTLGFLPGEGVTNSGSVVTKSSAIFSNVNYDLNDVYSGFLGLRFSEVEKDMIFRQDGFASTLPGIFLNGFVDIPETQQRQEDDFMSWTFGLNAQVADNSMLYGKVSRGYKEGGFNFRPQSLSAIGGDIDNPEMDFGREEVTSYEIGAKSDLLKRRLRLNLAAFYLDYEDIQTRVVEPETGVNRVVNGPTATSQGVEAEVNFRATRNLTLNASLGYSDAAFDDFSNCSRDIDCTGNQLPGAARVTSNMTATYTTMLDTDWEMYASANYSYRSSMHSDAQNLDVTELDSSRLINAQLGFVSPQGDWDVLFWAKNLADEDIAVTRRDQSISELGLSTVVYQAPRTFGITVTYNYF